MSVHGLVCSWAILQQIAKQMHLRPSEHRAAFDTGRGSSLDHRIITNWCVSATSNHAEKVLPSAARSVSPFSSSSGRLQDTPRSGRATSTRSTRRREESAVRECSTVLHVSRWSSVRRQQEEVVAVDHPFNFRLTFRLAICASVYGH